MKLSLHTYKYCFALHTVNKIVHTYTIILLGINLNCRQDDRMIVSGEKVNLRQGLLPSYSYRAILGSQRRVRLFFGEPLSEGGIVRRVGQRPS